MAGKKDTGKKDAPKAKSDKGKSPSLAAGIWRVTTPKPQPYKKGRTLDYGDFPDH